jgi:hypothetical protein
MCGRRCTKYSHSTVECHSSLAIRRASEFYGHMLEVTDKNESEWRRYTYAQMESDSRLK